MPGARQANANSEKWYGGNERTRSTTVREPTTAGATRSEFLSQNVGTGSYGSGLNWGTSGSVAVLVLLAAAAGARVVAPDLRGVAPDGDLGELDLGLHELRLRGGAPVRRGGRLGLRSLD